MENYWELLRKYMIGDTVGLMYMPQNNAVDEILDNANESYYAKVILKTQMDNYIQPVYGHSIIKEENIKAGIKSYICHLSGLKDLNYIKGKDTIIQLW